jgi:hypothetical protein
MRARCADLAIGEENCLPEGPAAAEQAAQVQDTWRGLRAGMTQGKWGAGRVGNEETTIETTVADRRQRR